MELIDAMGGRADSVCVVPGVSERSLGTALWRARVASGLLPHSFTTTRDTTSEAFGAKRQAPYGAEPATPSARFLAFAMAWRRPVFGDELVVRIPHSLGAAEAQKRIAGGVGAARAQYGSLLHASKLEWDANRLNFSLSALAQTIQGSIDVEDKFVELKARLPLVIGMLVKRFLPVVESVGQKLLK